MYLNTFFSRLGKDMFQTINFVQIKPLFHFHNHPKLPVLPLEYRTYWQVKACHSQHRGFSAKPLHIQQLQNDVKFWLIIGMNTDSGPWTELILWSFLHQGYRIQWFLGRILLGGDDLWDPQSWDFLLSSHSRLIFGPFRYIWGPTSPFKVFWDFTRSPTQPSS